jgi:hypothetical protein
MKRCERAHILGRMSQTLSPDLLQYPSKEIAKIVGEI